jgi:PKD repeat protein
MVGQSATFDASASRASANHRIVSYTWAWGDGSADTTAVSPTTQHTYNNARTYSVTLTVRDDLGQSATVTHAVVVGNGLTAVLTRSPQGTVTLDQTVTFDGSQSSSSTGTQITNYLFDFGDGTSQSSSFNTAKHEYTVTGTYTAKLTITDERGQTASATDTVTVQNAP